MVDLEQRLKHLGYDRRWLTFGFLDVDILDAQHVACLTSDDSNAEHYRFASFGRILAERSSLTDVQLEQYLELAALDPASPMANSALGDLLGWPGLTSVQFERLASHAAFELPFLQRLVLRRRLLASISTGPIDDVLMASCIASKDSTVQHAALCSRDITDTHLDLLARSGCNRAVRNLATQHLRRRFNDSPN